MSGEPREQVNTGSCPLRGEPQSMWPGRSIRRWSFLLLGLLSVGIGFVGVFLPGLPTTVFLILASYFFMRSCPWLEERLVRAPIFRPYLQYLDGDRVMPLRARLTTIAMMWGASSISLLMVGSRGAIAPWFVITIVTAAAIGSGFVMIMFRGRR